MSEYSRFSVKCKEEENPEAAETIIYSKLSNYSFQDPLNFI